MTITFSVTALQHNICFFDEKKQKIWLDSQIATFGHGFPYKNYFYIMHCPRLDVKCFLSFCRFIQSASCTSFPLCAFSRYSPAIVAAFPRNHNILCFRLYIFPPSLCIIQLFPTVHLRKNRHPEFRMPANGSAYFCVSLRSFLSLCNLYISSAASRSFATETSFGGKQK